MAQKTYKFRIYPSKAQVTKLDEWLRLCCDLYNAALQERREAYKFAKKSISYAEQNRQLKEIKVTNPEYAEINSHVLQDTLQRLDKSFKGFFSRLKAKTKAGFPRFKPRGRFRSFSFPNTRYSISEGRLHLSRFGAIKIKQDCPVEGTLKTATIKDENGKWFVCLGVEYTPVKLAENENKIGIDVGLKSFAVLSDGTVIDNPRYFEQLQKKLRVAQRRVARRKKGSNRRRKAVRQLRNIHLKIRNQRNDFTHKVSTGIVNNNGLIVVENLNTKGLASGWLAKQVNDAAWGSFFIKLRYKAENAGRQLVEVNPAGTSQTCLCGASVPKTLAVRVHICSSCGLQADRDFVSARVILQRALRQSVQAST